MYRMEDGRIPKDLLYGELESDSRPIGRPKLRFKDVCKRNMLATGLSTDNWESHAADRSDWRSLCSLALQAGEERLKAEAKDRGAKRRAAMSKAACVPEACVFVCSGCGRACRSRSNISKTSASVSSPVPNTEKIMKSRGAKPRGLYCFRGVWIR